MIFSTSFFDDVRGLILLIVLFAGSTSGVQATSERFQVSVVPPSERLEAELSLSRPLAVPSAPQKALAGSVRWSVNHRGVEGSVDFTFFLMKNGKLVVEHKSSTAEWDWYPRTPGNYKLRVRVADDRGRTVTSDWSRDYQIAPAVDRYSLFAVLPTENLSGVRAPLSFIRDVFTKSLLAKGFNLLNESELQDFLRENRVRYTGGLGSKIGKAFRDDLGNDAVFVLSLETYQQSGPPKISLLARLVTCGEQPEIAWMDSTGLSGNEAPGFLELGLIVNDKRLILNAVAELMDSFDAYLANRQEAIIASSTALSGGEISSAGEGSNRFAPQSYYRSSTLDFKEAQSVAVLPFVNRYARKNAGKVVPLHLVARLLKHENLKVIEPGLIREALLKYRIVMEAGPSLSIAKLMASKDILDVDLLVFGNVFDYQGLRGEPKVHFSVQAVETRNREVAWWSNSYAAGNKGVLLFDIGRIYSAHDLTRNLAESIVSLLVEGSPR